MEALMAFSLYPAGLGGTVDVVATNRPFYGLDSVAWYVHFGTGVDALAPKGRDKQRPLKTLLQAHANASPNDVIVLLEGHDEVLSNILPISKEGLVIVGCGQTAGLPSCRLRLDAVSGPVLAINAQNVHLRNLHFGESLQPQPSTALTVSDHGFVLDGCYIEVGANDYGGLVLATGADHAMIRDTTFISTVLVAGAQPYAAVTNSGPIDGLVLDGLVVSDGVLGYANGYGLDLSAGAATNIRGYRLSLLLGASAKLGASATGFLLPVVTGGGVIDV
jgi:hypothetical protein